MLDIKFLRENPNKIKEASQNKGVNIDIAKISKLDEEVRKLNVEVQELQAKRNAAAREKNVEEGKKIKEELKEKEQRLKDLSDKLKEELYKIPNLPADDVKVGKDESENEVVKKHGEPTKF